MSHSDVVFVLISSRLWGQQSCNGMKSCKLPLCRRSKLQCNANLQAYFFGTLPESVTSEEKQKAQIDRMIALRYIRRINLLSVSLFQVRAHSDTHIDMIADV